MQQRSQSGIELIVNYGMMLLVMLVVLLILFVLVSTPSNTIPTTCSIYGTLNCVDIVYGSNALGGSRLIMLASVSVTGTVNVTAFNAVVGGLKSTSGYCTANGIRNGNTSASQGQALICVAAFPLAASTSQTYIGTFNITANYCPSANSSSPCPRGSSYKFAGSLRTRGVYNPPIPTTSTIKTTTYTTTSVCQGTCITTITSTSTTSTPTTSLPSSYVPLEVTARPSVPTTLYIGQSVPVNALATGGTGLYTYKWVSSFCPGAAASGSGNSLIYAPTALTANCVFTFTANDIYTSNSAATAPIIALINPLCITNVIGTWTNTNSYPNEVISQSCTAANNYIYCGGGYLGPSGWTTTNSVYYAPVSNNGLLGGWSLTTPYPTTITDNSCVTSGGYIYCVGGTTSGGPPEGQNIVNSIYYAPISGSGVGSWVRTTPYPVPVSDNSCVASGGYIYCVGGFAPPGGTITGSVYSAPLSSAGVGAWSAVAESYPIPVVFHSCVLSNDNTIYCVDGQTQASHSSGTTNSVYYAQITAPGVLGSWSSATPYPLALAFISCLPLNGNISCVGGDPQGLGALISTNSVYYAPVSSNGVLGSWSSAAPYVSTISAEGCTLSESGYVSCVGGFSSGSIPVNTVSSAPQCST
jgi:hypothetical protein